MHRATPQKRRRADPTRAPFSAFLERDSLREQRNVRKHRTLVVSLVLHALLFAGLAVYSFWDVKELFGPSVAVRVFSPAKLPPEAAALREPTLRELSEPPPAQAPTIKRTRMVSSPKP